MNALSLPEPSPLLAFLAPRLRALGYDEAALALRLGRRLDEYDESDAPRDGPRLARGAPLDLAIAALFLQEPLAPEALRPLASEEELRALAAAGLLERRGDGRLRARFHVYACGDLLLLTDSRSSAPVEEAVLTPGTDSYALVDLLDRRPARRGLDLTTGSGVHALVLARSCEEVLAVDVAPRAAACAHWNAWWNGAASLRVAEGDLFAPACGARFDRIVADPPFVPSPRGASIARDGGPRGDAVARRILRGLAGHLAPGGTAAVCMAVPIARPGGAAYGDIAAELARGAEEAGAAPLAGLWQAIDQASAADYAAMQAAAEIGPAARPADVEVRAAHLAREGIHGLELGVLHVRAARAGEAPLAFEAADPPRATGSLVAGARAFREGGGG